MQIGILGSGVTAQTIGSKLIQLGHEVMLGSREEANANSVAWAKDQTGQHALYGTFMNAAAFGEIIFNCTLGSASLDVLQQAGAENLRDKVLIDTAKQAVQGMIFFILHGNGLAHYEPVAERFPVEGKKFRYLPGKNTDTLIRQQFMNRF